MVNLKKKLKDILNMENELRLINDDPKTIRCQSCSAKLMNTWEYAKVEDPDVTSILFATCPFCNGQSDVFTIDGFYRIGPIGSDESNKPTVIFETERLDDKSYKIIIEKK